jgi:hypothetical protein
VLRSVSLSTVQVWGRGGTENRMTRLKDSIFIVS